MESICSSETSDYLLTTRFIRIYRYSQTHSGVLKVQNDRGKVDESTGCLLGSAGGDESRGGVDVCL
jgi:hypothetical protein